MIDADKYLSPEATVLDILLSGTLCGDGGSVTPGHTDVEPIELDGGFLNSGR